MVEVYCKPLETFYGQHFKWNVFPLSLEEFSRQKHLHLQVSGL